jgi:hypothetical protein
MNPSDAIDLSAATDESPPGSPCLLVVDEVVPREFPPPPPPPAAPTALKPFGVAIDPAQNALGLTIANLCTRRADFYLINLDEYCPPKEKISCNTTLCEVVFRFLEDFHELFVNCGVFIIEHQNQRPTKDKNRGRNYEITLALSLLLYNTIKARYVQTIVLHQHVKTTRAFWGISVSEKTYPGLTKDQHYRLNKKLSDSTNLLNDSDKKRVHEAMTLMRGKQRRFHVDSTEAGLMLMCFIAKRNELVKKYEKKFITYMKDGEEDNRNAVRACVRNLQLHFPSSSGKIDEWITGKQKRKPSSSAGGGRAKASTASGSKKRKTAQSTDEITSSSDELSSLSSESSSLSDDDDDSEESEDSGVKVSKTRPRRKPRCSSSKAQEAEEEEEADL